MHNKKNLSIFITSAFGDVAHHVGVFTRRVGDVTRRVGDVARRVGDVAHTTGDVAQWCSFKYVYNNFQKNHYYFDK